MIEILAELYKLTARDLGDPWARIYYRRLITAPVAAAGINTQIIAPPGRLLILTNATMRGDPGAGQNVSRLAILHGTPVIAGVAAEGNIIIAGSIGPAAADIQSSLNWSGKICIPGGSIIQGDAQFNAGVALNGCTLALHGFTVPFGTVILP